MKTLKAFVLLLIVGTGTVSGQANLKVAPRAADSVTYIYDPGNIADNDTAPTVNLGDVNIISFKTKDEWMMYYKYKSRILKVMPYVKIAKQQYAEMQQEKENDKRRDYKHYRKDVEKEMRGKFENELKNLTTSQGEMLFKLLNRETHNNAYTIIKDVKGSMTAWVYQILAKRWGYDLKEKYNPEEEKMIELIIKELGPAYNI
jgi:hypothetical protein